MGERFVTLVPVAVQVFTCDAGLLVKAVQTVIGPVVHVPAPGCPLGILYPDCVKSPARSEACGTVAVWAESTSTIFWNSSDTKKKVLSLPL